MKFCTKCGAKLPDDAKFCIKCGAQQPELAEFADEGKEKAEEKKEEVSEKLEEVKAAAGDKLSEVKANAEETLEKFGNKIDDFADKAEQKADKIVDSVVGSLAEADKREDEELQGIGATAKGNVPEGGSIPENTADLLVKVIAGCFAAYFLYLAIRGVWGILGLFRTFVFYIKYIDFSFIGYAIRNAIANLLLAVPFVLFAALLVVMGFKRKRTQTTELLVATAMGACLITLTALISGILLHIPVSKYILIAWLAVILLFAVLYLAGFKTVLATDFSDPKALMADALNAVKEAVEGVSEGLEAKVGKKESSETTATHTGEGFVPTDRSLVKYIIFTILTCGIYSFFFIHHLARDVNIICEGDGKKTRGLGQYILLTFVTCGFYSLYWLYSIGNRLQETAPRYGKNFTENGTTILLWTLVGSLACGLGPYVAMHILITNTNSLAQSYNEKVSG